MKYLTVQELSIQVQRANFFQSDFRKEDYDYRYQYHKFNAKHEKLWQSYCYCIFLSGTAHLTIAGRESRFRRGDLCFYQPGQSNVQHRDTQYSCFAIYFSVSKKDTGEALEFNDQYSCFLDQIPTLVHLQNPEELIQLTAQYDRFRTDSERNYLSRQLWINQIVLALYNLYQPNQDHEFYHPAVKKAIQYMNTNLDLAISMTELANAVGISEKYFQKIFKSSTGYTPNEYLTHQRLEKAVHQLLNTSMSIADIAFESGFSSTTYFGHVFKKHYHCTPT